MWWVKRYWLWSPLVVLLETAPIPPEAFFFTPWLFPLCCCRVSCPCSDPVEESRIHIKGKPKRHGVDVWSPRSPASQSLKKKKKKKKHMCWSTFPHSKTQRKDLDSLRNLTRLDPTFWMCWGISVSSVSSEDSEPNPDPSHCPAPFILPGDCSSL